MRLETRNGLRKEPLLQKGMRPGFGALIQLMEKDTCLDQADIQHVRKEAKHIVNCSHVDMQPKLRARRAC